MSDYTQSLGLEKITPGSQAGLWGNTTNNTYDLLDQAICGVTQLSFSGASGATEILTDYNGAADQARSAVLNITGSATGANTIVVPNKQKTYLVRNFTGQNITFQTPVPNEFFTVEAGNSILIFCDGNNNVFTGIAAPAVGTLTVSRGGTGSTTFGSGGFIKSPGGTGALTASQYVALGSEVSGALPVSNGGTGVSAITSNALVVGAGSGPVTAIAPGTAGQVLTSNGTVWLPATPSAGVTSVNAGTNISITGTSTSPTVNVSGQIGVANGGTGVSTFAPGFVKSPGSASNLTTVTAIDLSTSDVIGTLTVGRGGTGTTNLTSSALLVGNGAGSITSISPGANGTVLTSNGSAWAAASLPSFVTGVNAGNGISVVGTTSPTITNTGVIGITAGTNVTITPTGTGTYSISATAGGTGTVTSVSLSTGATGLTVSGSTSQTINTNGTFAIGGVLKVENGGTNATTAAGARTSLGLGTMAVETASNYYTASQVNTSFAALSGATFSGNIRAPIVYAGSSPSTALVLQSNAVNFYAAATGNQWSSIFYTATSTLVTDQYYDFAYNNNNSGVLYVAYYFRGDGTASALNWNSTSDVRVKENIVPLSDGLNTVSALKPVRYSFKHDDRETPNHYGLIAQDLESVIPDVVTEGRDQYGVEKVKSVSYTEIIPILVKAIQELKAEVDAMKAAK